MQSVRSLGDFSSAVVQIPSRSKLTTGVCFSPMAETEELRALESYDGVAEELVVPFPNCPLVLLPQHFNRPPDKSAHA